MAFNSDTINQPNQKHYKPANLLPNPLFRKDRICDAYLGHSTLQKKELEWYLKNLKQCVKPGVGNITGPRDHFMRLAGSYKNINRTSEDLKIFILLLTNIHLIIWSEKDFISQPMARRLKKLPTRVLNNQTHYGKTELNQNCLCHYIGMD